MYDWSYTSYILQRNEHCSKDTTVQLSPLMLSSVSLKNKWPTAVLAKYSTISIYTMTLSMKFTKVSSQSHDWDQ